MTGEILDLCRAMGAPEDQEELLLRLIDAVQAGLASRLKPGTAPEDCGAAFPLAAAMMVMDALEKSGGSAQKVASFTAGDLTIRQETGTSQGRYDQAQRLLAPWLGNTGFFFRGVKG